MSRSPKRSGGQEAAAGMHRAKTKPDVLQALSSWLRSQWLRHYVMFSALGCEADREKMAQIGSFIDALREVRK